MNNGWFDSAIHEKSYIDYSYNNSYRQLINSTTRDRLLDAYYNQCLPALQNCTKTGTDAACTNADFVCFNTIELPIAGNRDWDVYDIRAPVDNPNPPDTYVTYLARRDIMKAIGARSKYQECASVGDKFQGTGDRKFPTVFLWPPQLTM